MYRPVISPTAAERIRHLPPDVKRGVREAIRAICLDPGCGEPLERELQDYRKYRVRRYRIVYRVDRAAKTVAIVAVGHRRTIYEEMAGTVRPRLRRKPSGARRPPGRRAHGHAELDELKRQISLEVLARHRPEEIRRRSLENLARWRKSGAWCSAHEEWLEILERGDEQTLLTAMVGVDNRCTRLRQSLPYTGMLPREVLERLREEIAA